MAEVGREVAFKAYDFFQKRGGELGKELDDWFKAETAVLFPVALELTEANGNYQVKAAVPGFKPEEIKTTF